MTAYNYNWSTFYKDLVEQAYHDLEDVGQTLADVPDSVLKNTWGAAVSWVAHGAIEFSRINSIPNEHVNAIAHLYVSAQIVYNLSEFEQVPFAIQDAEILGDIKEFVPHIFGDSNPQDTLKDQWNNEIGREIGRYASENDLTQQEMQGLLLKAYTDGIVAKDEDDPRLGGDPNWHVTEDFATQAAAFCFPDDTLVMTPSGEMQIAAVAPGDIVLAPNASIDGGCGALVEARVVRVFRNVTPEWFKLVQLGEAEVGAATIAALGAIQPCRDTERDPVATYVTPGHAFLNEFGQFERIDSIAKRGGSIVNADGDVVRVTAERLVYSAETAHMFEEAEVARYQTSGGLACEPTVERGWATYNFEVETYHTYIANGWRVHNDSQKVIDTAGAIGQAFGSQLGQMLTSDESQFVQLATGTALGVVTRNLAEVIADTGYHLFDGSQVSFSSSLNTAFRQLEDINVDFASAAAGTASSFLIAELGEALGLEGFGADLFSVSAGSYAGSVLNVVAERALDPTFSGSLLSGADFTNALNVLPGAVGTFFGSALAKEILPAESIQGQIGGSLGSIAGSALGVSAIGGAIGQSLGFLANFILPGIGAFFGTIIGTFLGDLFADDPDPHANIDLFMAGGPPVDHGGLLEVFSQWTSYDGFPQDATEAWARAVHELSLDYLRTVGGFELANAYRSGVPISQVLIDDYGFYPNQYVRLLQEMDVNVDGNNNYVYRVNGEVVGSAAEMVDGAIAGFIQGSQVIGGNLLLQRAAQNSKASDTPTLNGDMSVAEEYQRYLNDRDVINAVIASQPDSVFAAGWAIVLAQAAELGLSDVNLTDFHGGLGGFLASLAEAGISVLPSDVTVTRNSSNGEVTIDVTLQDGVTVPGAVDVFADRVEQVEIDGVRHLHLVFENGIAAAQYNTVSSGTLLANGRIDVTGETTGRDIWFAADGAGHDFTDSGIRFITANADEVISSDDILIGADGNDNIDGAEGWDWISGGGGNDTLRGGSEDDVLFGGAGNDYLDGGWGIDYLEGGAGADTIVGGVFEGFESDAAVYSTSNAAVTINLATGSASGGHATGDTLINIVDLVGSRYNDTLIGNQFRNIFEGGLGADTMNGGVNVSGDIYDFASYQHSATAVVASLQDSTHNTAEATGDTYINIRGLIGSAFGDTLVGNQYDNVLWGLGGDDLLIVGIGADEANGAFGFDTMSYRELGYGITLDLDDWGSGSAEVANDIGRGIEAFEGTVYADTLNGSDDGADVLIGNAGDDTIDGRGGDDYLYGGDGNDILIGAKGNDTLNGEDGIDELAGGDGDDTLDGGSGVDALRGGQGNDTYIVDNVGDATIENANGGIDSVFSSVNFFLWNKSQHIENLSLTGSGNINAGGNNLANNITGNSGNNEINGGGGADRIIGGQGNDILTGGAGADVFVFLTGGEADRITDFQNGIDKMTIGLGVNNFSNITVSDAGANTILSFGSNTITLENFDHRLVSADDFNFV